MNKNTIKLVSAETNPRAKLFNTLLTDSDNYKVSSKINVEIQADTDYNVFFDFNGFEDRRDILITNFVDLENKSIAILDISNENFDQGEDVDFYIVAIATAGFVTCSSELIQENIYRYTGRLASIVYPLLPPVVKKPKIEEKEKPSILWYGKAKDALSIRPYLTVNSYNIRVACPSKISNTSDRAETTVINNEQRKLEAIEASDIIFLPKTYTELGEINRLEKVKESISLGKFVIAPELEYDFDALAFDGSLEEGLEFYSSLSGPILVADWISDKQEVLSHKYSFNAIKAALIQALDMAPEDEYIKNFEDIMNSGQYSF